MSGSVRISHGNAWTPPGWVFDNVLEDIAKYVARRDPKLSHTIIEATEGFQYLDASQWSRDQIVLLLDGARLSRQQRLSAGASAFQKPEFFPGFMTQIEELIGQIETDPRMLGQGPTGRASPAVRTPPQG